MASAEHIERVREALLGLRWSQAELGRRLGVSPTSVSAWMTGKAPVPGYALAYLGACERLAAKRDTDVTYLSSSRRR